MMKLANASLILSTATFGLMLGVAQNAQAAGLIPNVTVSNLTGTTSNLGWDLINIVNGSGLPGNSPSLTGNHANTAVDNAWRSANNVFQNPNTVGITFDLGPDGSNLAGLSFWNATGGSTTSIFGAKNVTFEYSLNGMTFSALTPIAFNGVAGAWTGAFTQGGAGPQLVDFNPVYARYVKFNITSNYGGQRLAINEVQFKAVPEPSASLALLALGLAGVGLRKRA